MLTYTKEYSYNLDSKLYIKEGISIIVIQERSIRRETKLYNNIQLAYTLFTIIIFSNFFSRGSIIFFSRCSITLSIIFLRRYYITLSIIIKAAAFFSILSNFIIIIYRSSVILFSQYKGSLQYLQSLFLSFLSLLYSIIEVQIIFAVSIIYSSSTNNYLTLVIYISQSQNRCQVMLIGVVFYSKAYTFKYSYILRELLIILLINYNNSLVIIEVIDNFIKGVAQIQRPTRDL